MMKKFSARFAITLISIMITGAGVILGCAGGWWSVNERTNFTPELFVDSVYKPFFFSNEAFYYDINYDEAHDYRFNDAVVSDWSVYFGKQVSEAELRQALFSTTDKTVDSIMKGTVPVRLRSNKIFTSGEKKFKDFVNYLLLAKQAEIFALTSPDDWSYYDKPAVKRKSSADFCRRISSEFGKSKDKFMKQRLWFQLVRAYFFNDNYEACISTFENFSKEFSKGSLFYRSMSYAAGAYKKRGNIAKANYFYSLVYENEPLMKTAAHYSFKPQDESDWQKTLGMAQSVNEKCVL